MIYKSKAKAAQAARKLQSLLDTTGWEPHFQEVSPKHCTFYLTSGGMSLHESSGTREAYFTFFCHDTKRVGSGNHVFTVQGKLTGWPKTFSNPNKAVKAQLKKVREFQNILQEALEPFE